MFDFIKSFPAVSIDEYMWKLTVPQIHLASADNTHVVYLTDKQMELRNAKHYSDDNIDALSDLGYHIFNNQK